MNLVIENMVQIKSGITINVDASVKIGNNLICGEKILFGILVQVVVKITKYLTSVIDDSVITRLS